MPPSSTRHDSLSSTQGGELLKRSTFGERRSVPWLPFFDPPAKGAGFAKDGAYCIRIDALGNNQWDIQFRHREMTIEKAHQYALRFKAWADKPIGIRAKVGMSGAPYSDYWHGDFDLTQTPTEFTDEFMSVESDDPTAEFAFHLNDSQVTPPVTVCFNELHLTDPKFVPKESLASLRPPSIRVNQLGYLPNAKKRATWVLEGDSAESRAKTPMPFDVVDGDGNVLYQGKSEPFGRDPTSGSFVQRLDFSAVTKEGKQYLIRLSGNDQGASVVSDPFAVDRGIMRALSRDSQRFFYYMRSGIALTQPYVENPIWERIYGHPTDREVPCASDAKCNYSLDVSGGWYDAGDYGKYVVNAGLSTWLLMNLWEVSQLQGLAVMGSADRDLNIPESGNGAPDLLDEVKWELAWMLKMQVPEGHPGSGLVHHKMHDEAWSSLAVLPVKSDKINRTLRPVSTAATLNLAATAAQAARVFAQVDPKFASSCLNAAKRAWDAAGKHPEQFITLSDNKGGGAYEDSTVSDERYWAATELYLTTGDQKYEAAIKQSPHYVQIREQATDPGIYQAIDWRTMDALATVSIALDRKRFAPDVRERGKRAIVEVAERYLALSRADGFGQPYAGEHYPWGSNSFMLNNGIVLAYAHALTKDARFLEGSVAALDYVLGRNALGKSHVSGYGSRPLINPHHRLWTHSVNPKFPLPPPGAIDGGPNTKLQDPYSYAANLGCIGQTCYVDHADAYSANEVAINWNAALAWLTSYVNGAMSVQ